eukprot:m.484559 g.484559  ORF g.484559 m.484559 type:complete len:867 (-) comp23425_c0_seq1:419-3019(-)
MVAAPAVARALALASLLATATAVCVSPEIDDGTRSCPPTIEVGSTCNVACNQGFRLVGDSDITCKGDGTWTDTPMCADENSCDSLPCDALVSTCVDAVAPAVGHTCVCRAGYVGEPGDDGSGCMRNAEIESVDGDIKISVGAHNSISLVMGDITVKMADIRANQDAIARLRSDLSDEGNNIQDTKTSVSTLRSDMNSEFDRFGLVVNDLANTTTDAIDELRSEQRLLINEVNNTVYEVGNIVSNDLAKALEDLATESNDQHAGHATNFSLVYLTLADLELNKASKTDLANAAGMLPDETEAVTCNEAAIGKLRFHKATDTLQVCKAAGWSPVAEPVGSENNPGRDCDEVAEYHGVSGLYFIQEHDYGTLGKQYCVVKPTETLTLGGDGLTIGSAGRSCRTILDFFDGVGQSVRWLRDANGERYQTLCDFTRNGGGWTLLVQSADSAWTTDEVMMKGGAYAAKTDYSVLGKADDIKNNPLVYAEHFEYRMEASEPGKYGGIWEAPRSYTFASHDNSQTDVVVTEWFEGVSAYTDTGLEKRMPWAPQSCTGTCSLLTTSTSISSSWHGTLVQRGTGYNPAPWLSSGALNPGIIWYWMREGPSLPDKNPLGTILQPAESCAQIAAEVTTSPGRFFLNVGSPSRAAVTYCAAGDIVSGDGLTTDHPAASCRFVYDHMKLFSFGMQRRFVQAGTTVVETFCDFDRAGWTLLMTVDNGGWDPVTLLQRGSPSLDSDFSILGHADNIKNKPFFAPGERFGFRLDAEAVGQYGGTWTAHPSYSFTSTSNQNTDISLVEKWGTWSYSDGGLEARMPWIGSTSSGLLTTSASSTSNWWGTIATGSTGWSPSPWINGYNKSPGIIWYWLKEPASIYL